MQLLTSEAIGPRRSRTPEGYLICHDVPLAHTRHMVYGPEGRHFTDYTTKAPLEYGDNGYIAVSRTADVLFAAETLAGFNGKPVTRGHPPVMMGPQNYRDYTVGVTANARRGEGEFADHLVADLIVQDADAIAAIERDDPIRPAERQVSPGYDASYRQIHKGYAVQDRIVPNHVAIVPLGRGGPTCAIGDAMGDGKTYYTGDEIMTTASTADAETVAKAGLWDKMAGFFKEPEAKKEATFDAAAFKAELLGDVKAIVTEAVAAIKPAEPEKKADPTNDTATLDAATADAKVAAVTPDAEVLQPGIQIAKGATPQATLDAATAAQRAALSHAATGEHKDTLKGLVGSRDISKLDGPTLDAIFIAGAELVRGANTLATQRTLLSATAAKFGPAGTKDAAENINIKAAAHWGAAAGHVA